MNLLKVKSALTLLYPDVIKPLILNNL